MILYNCPKGTEVTKKTKYKIKNERAAKSRKGKGNEEIEGTLEDAMRVAEEGLAYTQEPVRIQSEDGEDQAVLPWWGVVPTEDDIVTARFGDYGFYGEWCEI